MMFVVHNWERSDVTDLVAFCLTVLYQMLFLQVVITREGYDSRRKYSLLVLFIVVQAGKFWEKTSKSALLSMCGYDRFANNT